jgi:hypothetical protein
MSNLSRHSSLLFGFVLLAAPLTRADDYRISGPYTQENLSIFLIHSSRNLPTKKLLTLQEAMEQKKVVVYETGHVNELSIENLSSENVYIQSGDIVKGGQQDRVFPTDFMLTSHSGRVPIKSFCVEHGRWSKRGVEPETRFSASVLMAPNNVKMAARDKKNQAEVWNQVANSEQGLANNATRMDRSPGAGVVGSSRGFSRGSAMASTTSMQLALESKPVVEATSAYVESLSKIVDDKADVVGYAYTINGKVNSAEVYASNDLFRRMWPKLLKSSAAEALTEKEKPSAPPPDIAAVEQTLSGAEHGHESSKEVKKRVSVTKKESDSMILFETQVKHVGDGWLHRSYVAK